MSLEYLESLPKKRMGAGLLIRDDQHRALIVHPTYKPSLEIPGGMVEANESPKTCAIREALEELGLELSVGRLLVLDYLEPSTDRNESLQFVFDGGVLSREQIAQIRLPERELSTFEFVARGQLGAKMSERMFKRLEAAFMALEMDQMLYLENGEAK
jgi:8-oxo-dGTP diphosphatase